MYRISPSKLDGYAEQLQSWLKIELRKGRKQRRHIKQLYRDLVALGYTGSYDRDAAYARRNKPQRERLHAAHFFPCNLAKRFNLIGAKIGPLSVAIAPRCKWRILN